MASFNYVGKFSTHHAGSRKEIARVLEIVALEFYFPKGGGDLEFFIFQLLFEVQLVPLTLLPTPLSFAHL